ncbi:phosphorylase [bacterium]|nr:phosphorylase [bacterium]
MNFKPSELILNNRGAVYHLDLLPDEISERIILVGDPERVAMVSAHFDEIEVQRQHREFYSATGFYKGKRLSVVSTGIGTDNIDIVLNELHLLATVDLKQSQLLESPKRLRFIRLGTCGILQENIPVGAFIQSKMSVGFDALMHFYSASESYDVYQMKNTLATYFAQFGLDLPFYIAEANGLFEFDNPEKHTGITATLPGFYGPQGRNILAELRYPDFIKTLSGFSAGDQKIVNFEMESSGLFGLANLFGHECSCICLGLANRITGEFLKKPEERMEKLILDVLDVV